MDFKVLSLLLAALAAAAYAGFFLLVRPSLKAFFGSIFEEQAVKHILRLQLFVGIFLAILCRVGWIVNGGTQWPRPEGTHSYWYAGNLASAPESLNDWFAFIVNGTLTSGLVLTIQVIVLFLWSFAGRVLAKRV